MSTEATPQNLSTAVETTGISTATTTRTAENQRYGTIYHADTLAAAAPIWFHPLNNGSYQAVFGEHWTGATPSETGGPQSYSDYDVVSVPTWATIEPISGSVTGLEEIPTRLEGTRVVNSAVSRFDYLFTIGTIDGAGYITHHRFDQGQKILMGEELISIVGDPEVIFDAGCYIDGNFLVLFGTDEDGYLYRARKHWGRVGIKNDPFMQWEYWGTKGWYPDPEELTPLKTSVGNIAADDLNAVSYANFRDREYISVSREGVNTKVYTSRRVDPLWKPGGEIDSELVYFQPQMPYNPSAIPEGLAPSAIPYIAMEADVSDEEEQSLIVGWDLWPF